MKISCPRCNEIQYAPMDKNYIRINGHCWTCDKGSWERGWLPKEEFERREKEALRMCEQTIG